MQITIQLENITDIEPSLPAIERHITIRVHPKDAEHLPLELWIEHYLAPLMKGLLTDWKDAVADARQAETQRQI